MVPPHTFLHYLLLYMKQWRHLLFNSFSFVHPPTSSHPCPHLQGIQGILCSYQNSW